ncbi:MAG: DEAD/DEAH box helicase [Proteobacteria bacterium]|nr:DEAD/DEAH box helicase [Pseudomonadota bacterium]
MTFDSFGFPSLILSNIKALGYTTPTPIQTQAIPMVMEGRDLMGLAQTGTGKTAAFLLPILNRLMAHKPAGPRRKIRALILAPTRELAEQIHEAAMDLARATGIRSTTIYGGCAMSRQLQALRQGTDIVVACPGRLLDHMGQRTVDLSGVEMLVLDEADQMFDMGFLPGIKKILAALPRERQSMLFSATMPDAIRGLAAECLNNPETVRVGNSNPVETVTHGIYPVGQHLKTSLLQALLERHKTGSVLVFTRTKHRAKRLAETLAKNGHAATSIQGNLSQNQRKFAMDGFRSGRYRVLVATDIAARGIDVSQIEHVVNYDVPSTPETYTHRIGRTGRASRTGEAHTFVTGEDVSMVRAIERLLREPLTRMKLEGFDYNQSIPAGEKEMFHRPPLEPRGRPSSNRPAQGRAPSRSSGNSYGNSSGGGGGSSYGKPSGNSDSRPAVGYSNRPTSQPGDDIYAADRSNGDRPRGDRPGYGRPQGERPGYGRPQGARPQGARPQGTGYQGNRPQGARPQGGQGENSGNR